MEAGVFLALNESTPPDLIVQAAQAVEERGFHAIWVPEHVVLFDEYESNYPYSSDGRIGNYGKGMRGSSDSDDDDDSDAYNDYACNCTKNNTKNNKNPVLHRPPGNESNEQLLCLPDPATRTHLRQHNDIVLSCTVR